MSSERVLVVAPHPDDETIGAGGTIARHVAAGAVVGLVVVTSKIAPPWPAGAAAVQRRQTAAAARVLGVAEVWHYDYGTVMTAETHDRSIAARLAALVAEWRPDTVYLPSAHDIHRDHRIVFEAGLVATRPLPGCPVRRVYCYEIAPTARFWPEPFRPVRYIDIDGAPLAAKLAAMRCYETELRDWPHLRSEEGLRQLACERGVGVGLAAAECFEVIRAVER